MTYLEVDLCKLRIISPWRIQSEPGFVFDNQWTCVYVCESNIGTGRVRGCKGYPGCHIHVDTLVSCRIQTKTGFGCDNFIYFEQSENHVLLWTTDKVRTKENTYIILVEDRTNSVHWSTLKYSEFTKCVWSIYTHRESNSDSSSAAWKETVLPIHHVCTSATDTPRVYQGTHHGRLERAFIMNR